MPTKKPETPEELCWLYAVGCLESRVKEKTLDHEDYLLALEYVKYNEMPPAVLIRQWFPKPFEKLERNGAPCTFSDMLEYWRNNHKHNEETPVHTGRVTSVVTIPGCPSFARVSIYTTEENEEVQKSKVQLNLHNYNLNIDDEVLIHGVVVAEKI